HPSSSVEPARREGGGAGTSPEVGTGSVHPRAPKVRPVRASGGGAGRRPAAVQRHSVGAAAADEQEVGARRRAEEMARRQAEEAARRQAEEAARRQAERDAEMARIAEQERRRQEAERARRHQGSGVLSFDPIERTMPVRSVGPEGAPLGSGAATTASKSTSGASAGSQGSASGRGAASNQASGPVLAMNTRAPPAEPQDVRCPRGMVYIPAGPFPLGSAVNDPMRNFAEKRLQRVNVDGFCIDRFEYGGVRPSVNVTWFKARELCERRGKRLCTEEEWEKACKGPKGLRFPYGNAFDPEACNTRDAEGNDRSVKKSGSFRRCRSGYGLYDMAGNVAEWTATVFQAGAAYRTVKGGAANRPDWDTRCATRASRKPNTRNPFLGFRCCANGR
ncbi:MAG: formylglycine-generating enzyme family protein, partial [Deltaproteobacteria bacterium]